MHDPSKICKSLLKPVLKLKDDGGGSSPGSDGVASDARSRARVRTGRVPYFTEILLVLCKSAWSARPSSAPAVLLHHACSPRTPATTGLYNILSGHRYFQRACPDRRK